MAGIACYEAKEVCITVFRLGSFPHFNITKQEREAVLQEALGKELLLELPKGQTLPMKADLSMS